VTIGVSGDARAAAGLAAGCDAWYSGIGGTLPALAVEITRAARERRLTDAVAESERLAPLWGLFTNSAGAGGSLPPWQNTWDWHRKPACRCLSKG
jgi:4-hydroxy-tetrahydrodipicolinate synthase